jgi:hypothetical protein
MPGKKELKFRALIDEQPPEERGGWVDVYRSLVLTNYARFEGRGGRAPDLVAQLNEAYPPADVVGTLAGPPATQPYNAADMLLLHARNLEQEGKTAQAQQLLRISARLVEENVINPPAMPGDDQQGPADMSAEVPVPPSATMPSLHFGIEAERSWSQERASDLELLRLASEEDVRTYLESHLHSDRFYLEGDRIFLELPNRSDTPATAAALVWFQIPDKIDAAAPVAGTRAGVHAVPRGWDATLCTIPLTEWTSGRKSHSTDEISCRWCRVRLIAIELASTDGRARTAGA